MSTADGRDTIPDEVPRLVKALSEASSLAYALAFDLSKEVRDAEDEPDAILFALSGIRDALDRCASATTKAQYALDTARGHWHELSEAQDLFQKNPDDDDDDEDNPGDDDDGGILIEFAAVRGRDGWYPQVWNNDRPFLSTYTIEYDEPEALARAQRTAEDEADRYVGDWEVAVQPRT